MASLNGSANGNGTASREERKVIWQSACGTSGWMALCERVDAEGARPLYELSLYRAGHRRQIGIYASHFEFAPRAHRLSAELELATADEIDRAYPPYSLS